MVARKFEGKNIYHTAVFQLSCLYGYNCVECMASLWRKFAFDFITFML